MKFLILNGPNINLARWSEPGVPGEVDYTGLMDYVQAGCDQLGIETDICQSNHEGDLIDEIQSAPGRVDGIVLNPGGYAHYSVAILDALRLCSVPAVEVMLDAPDEREPFRKTDVVSFGCQGHFIGEGPQGYLHACIWLAQLLRTDGSSKAHIVMYNAQGQPPRPLRHGLRRATSPKGRGLGSTVKFPVLPRAPPLGELARKRLRGRACYHKGSRS